MVKEEIVHGLENAIAKGEPLEKAVQSFVNAGYNPQEVQQASQKVNLGVTGQLAPTEEAKPGEDKKETIPAKPKEIGKPEKAEIPSAPGAEAPLKKKRKFPWLVLILLVVFLALLGILGFILFKV